MYEIKVVFLHFVIFDRIALCPKINTLFEHVFTIKQRPLPSIVCDHGENICYSDPIWNVFRKHIKRFNGAPISFGIPAKSLVCNSLEPISVMPRNVGGARLGIYVTYYTQGGFVFPLDAKFSRRFGSLFFNR